MNLKAYDASSENLVFPPDYPLDNCTRNIEETIDAGQGGNVQVQKLIRSFSIDIIANVVFSLKSNAWVRINFGLFGFLLS